MYSKLSILNRQRKGASVSERLSNMKALKAFEIQKSSCPQRCQKLRLALIVVISEVSRCSNHAALIAESLIAISNVGVPATGAQNNSC
jgi:hypothetical protein